MEDPRAVLIRLERFPGLILCDGPRPGAYTLDIQGTGVVTITEAARSDLPNGPQMIRQPPRHYAISRDSVERLVGRFRDADFFSLSDEYRSGVTDQPGQRLTFRAGASSASVDDYVGESVGMPLVVRDLERAVDAAAGLAPIQCGGQTFGVR